VCAACSKSESSSTADTTTAAQPSTTSDQASACSIVSKEEMATAVGDAITATEEVNSNHCIFRTAAPLVYADVEIDRENGAAAWQGINAGDSTIGAQQDSLAGVAEKAFFGPRDRLYILRNGTFAAIEGGFDDKARSRAIAIAKLVAGKL
jgi:hypothetical protein